MPLIKPINVDVTQRRYRLPVTLLNEIDSYCTWANIKNDNQFIEEAVSYVLKKDKDWQKIRLGSNKDNA